MPSRGREPSPAVVLFLLTATCGLYFHLDPGGDRFFPWLSLYTLQFALYGLLAFSIHRRGPISIGWVLASATLARVLLWFTAPVFEADYYRYLWDGHVFSRGVNPYLYPPEAPELDGLETDYRFFIQWSQYRTIYPPVAQYVFRLAHGGAPDSLLGLKVALSLFDFGTGLVLISWLKRRGVAACWSALYFLNPLVLKEVANSAHVDVVAAFFATAALYLFSFPGRGRKAGAFALLALSIAVKLYALALAPLLARLDRRWLRNSALAGLVIALLYVPFLDAGAKLFDGSLAFGRYWTFNASLFRVLEAVAPTGGASKAAAAALFSLFVAWRWSRLRRSEELSAACLSVLGALLLLSPVVNAWYVLWLLPFACLERSYPWLAFGYLVGLSYSWFHHREAAPYFQLAEYTTLVALLAWRRARVLMESPGGERA